jgi:hypothetical protein
MVDFRKYDDYTCSECSFYKNKECYINPLKPIILWGSEKPCIKFVLNKSMRKEQ